MSISELGSVGELIGAIATVATLLYLALQIRANTLADKYKAINDIIDRIVGWQSRIANSTDLMEAWIQGTKSYNDLQIENKLRFSAGLEKWSVRLGVRTPGFHPGNRGSIPLRSTKPHHFIMVRLFFIPYTI